MDKIEKYKKLLHYIEKKDFDNAKNLIEINYVDNFDYIYIFALHISIQSQNYRMLEYLLKNGADPNTAISTCGIGFADFKEPAKINYK
ncbi:MAG: hypothetical protein ACK4IX_16410, partial [Candidatus Sericytochromatia bacterium]